MFRRRSFGRPSLSSTQAAKRTETRKHVARPAMIAYGRRRFSPTPPPSTIGRTGSTHGETAVISPATKAKTIARDHRWLFGLGGRLGCYSSVVVRSSSASAGGLGRRLPLATPAPTAAGMCLRGREVVRQRVRDLGDRPELFAGRVEQRGWRAACSPRRMRAARRRSRSAAPSPRRRAWPRSPRAGARASSPARRAAASPPGTRRSPCGRAPCARPRASRHVQRARICSGASGLPAPIARSRVRTPWTRSFSQVGAWVTRVTRSSKLARSIGIATRSASAIIRSRRFGFSAAQVKRNCSSAALLARAVSFSKSATRSSKRACRPAMRAQKRCSSSSR